MTPFHHPRRALPLLLLAAALLPACAGPRLELRYGVAKFADYMPLAEVDRLAAWGFDYIEPAVSKEVMILDDAAFEKARARAAAAPIRVEVMNWFIPPEIKLTGPDADPAKIRAYVEKALARAEALGAKVIVFGSGGSRSVPDGISRDRARDQIRDFLRLCGETVFNRGYGMVIGIEPLRKAESNILNTAAESLALARAVNHPKVRIIVDFYHLAIENESPDVLLDAKDWIVHIHFANPHQGRVFPKHESEDPRYAHFFRNLAKIGYRGRISLEANTANFAEDAREGLSFLRSMAAKYGSTE
jgi:sugar phosphate isomerase/epimerase